MIGDQCSVQTRDGCLRKRLLPKKETLEQSFSLQCISSLLIYYDVLYKICLFTLIHLKNRFVRLTSLKTFDNSMITLVYLISVLVSSSSNKPKENCGTPV